MMAKSDNGLFSWMLASSEVSGKKFNITFANDYFFIIIPI
ncbi:hypothetical protein ABID20_001005 [Rhizobium alvei]